MWEKNKVDKGFELIYWNLSYRRKFIRTLWLIPFGILTLIVVWLKLENFIFNSIITTFLIAIFIIQLIYNFIKWKEEKQSS